MQLQVKIARQGLENLFLSGIEKGSQVIGIAFFDLMTGVDHFFNKIPFLQGEMLKDPIAFFGHKSLEEEQHAV